MPTATPTTVLAFDRETGLLLRAGEMRVLAYQNIGKV